jgi:hypothetical protein
MPSIPGMTIGKDRRRHPRRPIGRACKLRDADALRYAAAHTLDFSEGGALLLLDTTRPLSEGQEVSVAIDFDGRAVLTQGQMVEAKVVRAGPVLNRRQTVALAFRMPVAMPGVAAVA